MAGVYYLRLRANEEDESMSDCVRIESFGSSSNRFNTEKKLHEYQAIKKGTKLEIYESEWDQTIGSASKLFLIKTRKGFFRAMLVIFEKDPNRMIERKSELGVLARSELTDLFSNSTISQFNEMPTISESDAFNSDKLLRVGIGLLVANNSGEEIRDSFSLGQALWAGTAETLVDFWWRERMNEVDKVADNETLKIWIGSLDMAGFTRNKLLRGVVSAGEGIYEIGGSVPLGENLTARFEASKDLCSKTVEEAFEHLEGRSIKMKDGRVSYFKIR